MQVREWVSSTGLENLSKKLVNVKEKVEFEKPKMSLDVLMKYGNLLVEEQVHCLYFPYIPGDGRGTASLSPLSIWARR